MGGGGRGVDGLRQKGKQTRMLLLCHARAAFDSNNLELKSPNFATSMLGSLGIIKLRQASLHSAPNVLPAYKTWLKCVLPKPCGVYVPSSWARFGMVDIKDSQMGSSRPHSTKGACNALPLLPHRPNVEIRYSGRGRGLRNQVKT